MPRIRTKWRRVLLSIALTLGIKLTREKIVPDKSFKIEDREVGGSASCFIIAEAGVNHNGDLDLAHKLVDAACEAGADCVKFQTFRADDLVIPDAPKARYQITNTGREQSQLDMLRSLELEDEAHASLMDHCKERGILFLSTP